jgi:phospho-N-acetylmuramoyl-pentapeptide-transferase
MTELWRRPFEALAAFHVWPPAAAFMVPLVLGLVLMPFGIGLLARAGMGQRIREEGPSGHLAKAGTPTSGGVLVIALVVLTVVLIDRRRALLPTLAALLLGGAFGLLDDILTVRGRQWRGLMARQRIGVQLLIGLVIGYWLYTSHADVQMVPLLGAWHMGWLIVPFGAIAVAGAANAFNLTDGSDGLAPGVVVVVALVLALMARNLHQVAHVRLLLAVAGSMLAFLAYNVPPARAFLGGVGAEGFGMMLAAVSISAGLMWYLPLLALVPLVETLSVVIQVASFKATGRRVFKMSPLHHHFQLSGWSEWVVALSAWAVSSAAGTIGLLLVRRTA